MQIIRITCDANYCSVKGHLPGTWPTEGQLTEGQLTEGQEDIFVSTRT